MYLLTSVIIVFGTMFAAKIVKDFFRIQEYSQALFYCFLVVAAIAFIYCMLLLVGTANMVGGIN